MIRGGRVTGIAAALLAVLAGAAPALAQQTPSFVLPPPAPAETGKPLVFEAPPRRAEEGAGEPRGCAAALPCDMRVIGAVRRGGAVELKATPFSW